MSSTPSKARSSLPALVWAAAAALYGILFLGAESERAVGALLLVAVIAIALGARWGAVDKVRESIGSHERVFELAAVAGLRGVLIARPIPRLPMAGLVLPDPPELSAPLLLFGPLFHVRGASQQWESSWAASSNTAVWPTSRLPWDSRSRTSVGASSSGRHPSLHRPTPPTIATPQ